jgi:hypothetical protein
MGTSTVLPHITVTAVKEIHEANAWLPMTVTDGGTINDDIAVDCKALLPIPSRRDPLAMLNVVRKLHPAKE